MNHLPLFLAVLGLVTLIALVGLPFLIEPYKRHKFKKVVEDVKLHEPVVPETHKLRDIEQSLNVKRQNTPQSGTITGRIPRERPTLRNNPILREAPEVYIDRDESELLTFDEALDEIVDTMREAGIKVQEVGPDMAQELLEASRVANRPLSVAQDVNYKPIEERILRHMQDSREVHQDTMNRQSWVYGDDKPVQDVAAKAQETAWGTPLRQETSNDDWLRPVSQPEPCPSPSHSSSSSHSHSHHDSSPSHHSSHSHDSGSSHSSSYDSGSSYSSSSDSGGCSSSGGDF